MKRLLILSLLLILMPLASAMIEIEGPSKDIYNLGDEISAKGYIMHSEDMIGFLKISLDCQEEVPVVTKSISVKKDTKKSFDENFVIPFYLTGDCSLKVSLEVTGDVIDQARSNQFIITKDLEGNFEIKDKLIQLGKDIEVKGNIFRMDGSNINGNAIIYFKQNGSLYNVGSSSIIDGKFEYVTSSISYPSGVYNLEVEALDNFGNSFIFTDIEPFTLVSEIYVFAKPSKLSVVPGSAVNIIGEAKTILQDKIEKAHVSILVNDTTYETNLKNSKFEYELILDENVRSGRHDIEIIVEDDLGNIGRTTTNFNVNAIPTSLYIETDVKSFIPGTKIKFKPVLLDQGGDFIIEDISVEMIDTDGDEIFNKVFKTNEQVEYEFEQYAKPGTWILKTYATGLTNEDQIYVGETLASDYSLEGQILTVNNIGNIVYKRPVEINLEGEESYTVVKKEKLDPGESFDIDLGENVKSGNYTVKVGDEEFTAVSVVGFTKRDYSWLYWIFTFIVLGLILYLFFKSIHKKRRRKREAEHEEKHLAEKVKDFLTKKGVISHKNIEKKVEKKEERIDRYKKEFKEKILEDIKKREKKIRQDVSKYLPKETQDYLKIKVPESDEEKKSLMDIFKHKKEDKK